MQLTIAKIICRLYAFGLAILALSLAKFFSGSIVAAALLAGAVGLALLQPWAFFPAYAVPMLYLVETVADVVRVRWLRPSSIMPGGVAMRFRSNWTVHYLLDQPAQFLNWYGVPKWSVKVLLCLMAIGALACAYRLLKKGGQLGVTLRDDNTFYMLAIAAVSKAAIALGVLIIAIAIWQDPPTGGRNPGGPGPGSTIGFAVLRAFPWLVIGGIGWAVTRLIRRQK